VDWLVDHHSERGKPNRITFWLSKCRVRSVMATIRVSSVLLQEEKMVDFTWSDVVGVFDHVKRLTGTCIQGLSATPFSSAFVVATHATHPVIRMTFALSLKRPTYRTLTSGNAK